MSTQTSSPQPLPDSGPTGDGDRPDPTPPRASGSPAAVRPMGAGIPTEKARDFRSSSRRLLALLREDRLPVWWIVALATVGVALTVVGPKILGHATDLVISGLQSPSGIDFGELHMVLLGALALFLASSGLTYLSAYLMAGIIHRTMRSTGSIGLAPTLAALRAGRTLALANKESLVAGGPLVRAVAAPGQIVPVDSEHSALAQCLRGGRAEEVRRLVLTASGGPFRGRDRASLAGVTREQALAHPTWDMGPVVTINSATLMNKALEVIEAHELFGPPYERIDVVVHPQSIVHSMVEFTDGSTIAQASPPDMRLPIALALGWPDRVAGAAPALDWSAAQEWRFEPLDDDAFPAVRLAKQVGAEGRSLPAVFNAANEECVAAFLDGRLPFTGIVDNVSAVIDAAVDGCGVRRAWEHR